MQQTCMDLLNFYCKIMRRSYYEKSYSPFQYAAAVAKWGVKNCLIKKRSSIFLFFQLCENEVDFLNILNRLVVIAIPILQVILFNFHRFIGQL